MPCSHIFPQIYEADLLHMLLSHIFIIVETKVALEYGYCLSYLLWTCNMWNMSESYAAITYFTAYFMFAKGFASITYYFKSTEGLLTHMWQFYIHHGLP